MINKTIKILIIDDDQVDRAITRRILSNIDIFTKEVTECDNAKSAIDLLSATKFDCILLDYQLPGTTGIDLFKKIKQIDYQFTPIIMLTGQGSEHVAVDAMKAGVTDYISKSNLEVNLLQSTIINALKKMNLDEILHERNKKSKHFSYYDSLTGLLNHHTLDEALSHAFYDAKKLQHALTIFVIDINNFLALNDSIGYLAGNEILIEVAHRLTTLFSKDVLISRYNEDEFVIILKNETINLNNIGGQAASILDLLSQPFKTSMEDSTLSINVNMGIAYYPGAGESASGLLKNAYSALEKAKLSTGSHFEIYTVS